MTAMLKALQDARNKLASDPGMDEQDMCNEVLKPLFGDLKWKFWDNRQFRGQFPIQLFKNRSPLKADYALFAEDDTQNPLLLIEAKRPGEMKDADDQVNTYLSLVHSAKAGIATDGRDWRIYLRKRGPKDRLALEFSLEEGSIEYLAELLPKVLQRDAVVRGDAERELEECYKQTQAERHFDEAWSQLLEGLPTLFIEKVKGLAGGEPRHHVAINFIQEKLAGEPTPRPVPQPYIDRQPKKTRRKTQREPMPAKGTLYLPGEPAFDYDQRANAIKELLEWAHRMDPKSLNRVGEAFVKRERTKHCKYQIGTYWVYLYISGRDAPSFVRKCAEALDKHIEYRSASGDRVTP